MTVENLHDFLLGLHPVRKNTVDEIVFGKKEMVVRKIGTCWQPYLHTLEQAYRDGVNVMVVHEPTFYSDEIENSPLMYDRREKDGTIRLGSSAFYRQAEEKRRWLREHDMAVIRCHDVLDIVPEYGIPYALGIALGFTEEDLVGSQDYFNKYRIPPQTAIEAAQYIAGRLEEFGQKTVSFYGDGNRKVETICVGTGCISSPIEMMDLEADLYLSINDAVSTWVETTYAIDTGRPLILIDHGASEEMGVRLLHNLFERSFELPCIHYPQGCTFQFVNRNGIV